MLYLQRSTEVPTEFFNISTSSIISHRKLDLISDKFFEEIHRISKKLVEVSFHHLVSKIKIFVLLCYSIAKKEMSLTSF